jgi:hypothetical protein
VGRRHPDTARAIVDLAAALEAEGNYSEAFHLHCEAAGVFRELLGDGHPATVAATHNLSHAAKTARNRKTADELEREVMAFSKVDWNSFYYQKYLELFTEGVFDEETDEYDVLHGRFVRKRYVSGLLCFIATEVTTAEDTELRPDNLAGRDFCATRLCWSIGIGGCAMTP